MPRRHRKKRFPEGIFTTRIDSLAHDGRGIARIDGKTTFIDGALPGELVDFVYTDSRRDFATGRTESVQEASPLRTEARCKHYGICGGCSLQHVRTDAQIELKQALLFEQFEHIGKLSGVPAWPPLTGPHWHYRGKARLGVKYVAKKGRVLIGFRERGSGMVADLSECPILNEQVSTLIPELAQMFDQLSIRARLPQVELAVGDGICVMVLRVMDEPSADDIAVLKHFGERHGISFQLQRGRPDELTTLDGDASGLLQYHFDNPALKLGFAATEFTQVNQDINRQMIERVLDVMDLQPEDRVLDLFCGLGNFTLPLATRAAQVTGVEGSQALVDRAMDNARLNGIGNVDFHVADLSKSLDDAVWAQQRYDKVLLDPSRAGAQELMKYLPVWVPSRVVYVSCNPSTLARDAGILVHELDYKLLKAGVMDMFPHTAHVESMALFER